MVAIDADEGNELRQFVDDVILNIGYSLTQNLLLVRFITPIFVNVTKKRCVYTRVFCRELVGRFQEL
jgi:hypothetical protein